jgi:hypothetical protein
MPVSAGLQTDPAPRFGCGTMGLGAATSLAHEWNETTRSRLLLAET